MQFGRYCCLSHDLCRGLMHCTWKFWVQWIEPKKRYLLRNVAQRMQLDMTWHTLNSLGYHACVFLSIAKGSGGGWTQQGTLRNSDGLRKSLWEKRIWNLDKENSDPCFESMLCAGSEKIWKKKSPAVICLKYFPMLRFGWENEGGPGSRVRSEAWHMLHVVDMRIVLKCRVIAGRSFDGSTLNFFMVCFR